MRSLLNMSYRYMRTILFFDLPVETASQQKAYRKFIKNIKKTGFYMMQKSVYVKMGMDMQASRSIIEKVKKICPEEGEISVLTITEKQFSAMELLLGEGKKEVIDSDERFLEL